MDKKFFLAAVCLSFLFLSFSLDAFAQTGVNVKMVCTRNINGNGSNTGTGNEGQPRSPQENPVVEAEIVNNMLYVDATELGGGSASVVIYDEDDNVVFSNAYSTNTVFVINLCSLPSGTYTIELVTDDYTYEGEFEL